MEWPVWNAPGLSNAGSAPRKTMFNLVVSTLILQVICVFEEQPGATYGEFNSSLAIPCVTNAAPSRVYWYRKTDGQAGNIIATESGVNEDYINQYDLIQAGDKNFTLRIKRVGWSEPQFSCRVYVNELHTSSTSNITTVAPPYGDPTCSMSSTSLTAGSKLTLTCNSAGGREAATLKWKDGDSFLTEGPGMAGTDVTDSNRGKRELVHEITIDKSDNRKQFMCTSNNTALTISNRGVLTCTTQTLDVKYEPEIKVLPAGSHTITEGDSATVTVTCRVIDANPAVTQFRYKLQNKHSNNWSSWTTADTKTYSGLTRSNDGEYKCLAKNSVKSTESDPAELVVHYKPEVGIGPSDPYTITEGHPATLTCTVTAANPDATHYRFQQLSNTWSSWGNTNTKTYNSLDRNKAGTYRCQAKNSVGTGEASSLLLAVRYPPSDASTPSSTHTVTKNDEVPLKCSVSDKGVPEDSFKFIWTKDGVGFTGGSDGEYIINSAGVEEDDGVYQCTPKNDVGSGAATTITVVVQTVPTVKAQPSDTTVLNTGNDLEMTCTFEAKPPADINWQYRNGSGLPSNVFSWSSEDTNNGKYTRTKSTLIWNSQSDPASRRNKDGEVKCVASNVVDTTQSGHRTLSIEYAPVVKKTDPDPPKVGVARGDHVTLFVEVEAVPHPTMFNWQKVNNGSVVPVSGVEYSHTDLSSNLTIESIRLEQFGEYKLTVTHKHRDIDVTFEINPQDKPDPPTELTLSVTAVSLTVEWDRGWDGGLPQTFHLSYSGRTKTIADSSQHGIHYIEKLGADDGIEESRQYTVSLYAQNDIDLSATVKATATTNAKPKVGETTIAHDKNNNQAIITWSITNPDSLTLVVVQVCEVKTTECLNTSIDDVSGTSTVPVLQGDSYQFSFFFYDGVDLVSTQENAKKISPSGGGSSPNLTIIGAVVGVIIFLAVIIVVLALWIRNKRTKGGDQDMSGKGLWPHSRKRNTKPQPTGVENNALTDLDPYAVAGETDRNGLTSAMGGESPYADPEPKPKPQPKPKPKEKPKKDKTRDKKEKNQGASNMPEYAVVNMEGKTKNRKAAKEDKAPVYAEVKKDKKKKAQNQGPIYAEVNKGNKKKNKNAKDSDAQDEFKYENVAAPQRKKPKHFNAEEAAYSDVRGANEPVSYDDNPYQEVESRGQAGVQMDNPYANYDEEAPTTSGAMGTVYADVEFKRPDQPNAPTNVHTQEDATEYAAIDFNRQGPAISEHELARYEQQKITELDKKRVEREHREMDEKRRLEAGELV